MVRHHVLGRSSTFTFDRETLQSMPVPISSLQKCEITNPDANMGKPLLEPISAESTNISSDGWLGTTMFPLTKEASSKYQQPFFNIDNKVHKSKRTSDEINQTTWLASVANKKKKDNEADLRESKMKLEDRLKFLDGKKAELSSIFENNVWHLETNPDSVDPSRVMKARFVLKWAGDGKGGLRAKARLVLQGFSDPDLLNGELDTSSPTFGRPSRQVMLSLMSLSAWTAAVADVTTAFLQGDPQQRELWAKLPKDACDALNMPHGSLMRLVKPLYGQPDAPRAWYMVAKRRLEHIGYQVHPLDGCLFRLYSQQGQLISLVGIHVDDLLIAGDESSAEFLKARQELREQFSFKHRTPCEGKPLEFCGCACLTNKMVSGSCAKHHTSRRFIP